MSYAPLPDRSREPRSSASTLSIVSFVLVLIILAVEGIRLVSSWERDRRIASGDKTAELRPIEPRGNLDDEEKTNIAIFERCSPSSVHVNTFNVRSDGFGFNVLKIPQGSGTGIVWDEKGRVITNFHVVANARRPDGSVDPKLVQVTLADHSTWNVLAVNYAQDKDLAVLWVDVPAARLQVAKIGESQNLKVGQKVYAIGNPFGLDQSLSTGIISALGREIETDGSAVGLKGLIQTDAAINPGNSGGPLLDSAGRLIGVNTAIFSPSGASAGIGFAIPIDEVNRVVTRLIKKDIEIRPSLGIYIAPDQIPRKLGVPGVLIYDLVPDGPAEKAGLKRTVRDKAGNIRWGDIIVAIDDKKVTSSKDMFNILEACKAGQEIAVTVHRDDTEATLKLTLGATGR